MGAIENVKELAELVKKLGNMDLYKQILDLQGEIMDLTQAIREREETIRTLENKLSIAKKMVFKNPFYYVEGDDVPHCPRCWEVEKLAVHYPPPFNGGEGPIYTCPQCNEMVIHPRKKPPGPPTPRTLSRG